MSKENTFLIFVVEYYRNKKNLSGKEIIALFDKYDIWDVAKKSYFLWHIESPDNFVQEIDKLSKADCYSANEDFDGSGKQKNVEVIS